MRIKNVWPAKNFILYVEFEEGGILKYDMWPLINENDDFFELFLFPEQFISAKPVDEGRGVGWDDDIKLKASFIEEGGENVDVGFLTFSSMDEIVLLRKYQSEPLVKKVLDSRYGNMAFLEKDDYAKFHLWLFEMSAVYLSVDSGGEYYDTKESSTFEYLALDMVWPEANHHDWWEFDK